ncbi:hypothetical protein GCM10009760_04300 [Kitasatospora kazusensis]|uniref:Uncharacterized protein n=1 Tax=Kitasatospora kazusensis TaxID=407974 RepID=A0ABN2YQM0_9ACTN
MTDMGLCPTPRPSLGGGGRQARGCTVVVVNVVGRGTALSSTGHPRAYPEPPGAAKAKRKRHDVSLGGPWRTRVRRSCPIEEGTTPLSPRSAGGSLGVWCETDSQGMRDSPPWPDSNRLAPSTTDRHVRVVAPIDAGHRQSSPCP